MAACSACALSHAFLLPSFCAEVGYYNCENFFGAWRDLTDCRDCCTYLSAEERRADFLRDNCKESAHFFNMGVPTAEAGVPDKPSTEPALDAMLHIPAQAHSTSGAYPLSAEMAADVFKRAYRTRVPYMTLREHLDDHFANEAKAIMTGRARYMDRSFFRQATQYAQVLDPDRETVSKKIPGSVYADVKKLYGPEHERCAPTPPRQAALAPLPRRARARDTPATARRVTTNIDAADSFDGLKPLHLSLEREAPAPARTDNEPPSLERAHVRRRARAAWRRPDQRGLVAQDHARRRRAE